MANADSPSDDLRVECSETSSVLRSVSVEVDAARVAKAFDRAYSELKKGARVKGFRPGKVPRSVLERMYGASMPEEIERALVTETLPKAIEQAGVTPVSEPDIEAEQPADGKPFHYTARVEIKPEIELPALSGLKGRKPVASVADEDVQSELEQLAERNVQWIEEAEDVAAADGHSVTLDFVGRVDGEVFQGGSGQGMEVQIGSGTMVPGFEEQLVGVVAGDDRQVSVTFPESYGPEELNGKDAVFECHIVAVKRREEPNLDDEFAKDLGEFETLDELKDRIRKDLAAQRESSSEQALNASLMDSLLEQCDFEVPPGVVARQLQSQLHSMHQQYQGKVPDDVLREQLGRMEQDGLPAAERRVREALALDAVVVAEGIAVTPDEVDARLAEMAESQGMELDQVKMMAAQQGWGDAIEAELKDKKAYAHLAEQAEIEEFDPALAIDDAVLDDEGDESADAP
jgi:trigger factor